MSAKLQRQINALSLSNRKLQRSIAGLLGNPVETNRNIICQYGYPEEPCFSDFYSIGTRTGLGKAVINRKVDKTWATWPEMFDVSSFDDKGKPADFFNDSDFIKQFDALVKSRKLQFWPRLKEGDKRQRYGQYAGLLLVVRDPKGRKPSEPIEGLKPGMLEKIVPLYEDQLEVSGWETDESSPRYGEPKMYQVNENAFIKSLKDTSSKRAMQVHPSRIVILSENANDGSIYGYSALQGCLYACMDYEKARMSSAEGIKRQNSQRYVTSLQDGASLPKADSVEAEMMDENFRDFDNGDQTSLLIAKANVTPFNATFHDPDTLMKWCANEAAASDGLSAVEYVGHQTGERASREDNEKTANTIMERCLGFGTSMVMQVVDRLIDIGILPRPNGTPFIKWQDQRDPSLADKLEMIERMGSINEKFVRSGQPAPFETSEARELADFGELDGDGEDDAGEDSCLDE